MSPLTKFAESLLIEEATEILGSFSQDAGRIQTEDTHRGAAETHWEAAWWGVFETWW